MKKALQKKGRFFNWKRFINLNAHIFPVFNRTIIWPYCCSIKSHNYLPWIWFTTTLNEWINEWPSILMHTDMMYTYFSLVLSSHLNTFLNFIRYNDELYRGALWSLCIMITLIHNYLHKQFSLSVHMPHFFKMFS